MAESPEDELFLRESLGDLREPCEEDDDGPRRCCGSRQLGPHADDCTLSPSMREAMLDHERMYRHENEVSDD
jgi:hypothetical protein